MMNFSTNAHGGGPASKENVPSSNKTDALQVQRSKPRAVLGVLSENELRGRSLGQGSQLSKHSSISDSSQLTFLGCTSSSGYDVYVEEACEVVLAASGQEVVPDSRYLDAETSAMQNEDFRLLLELNSSSCKETSMQSGLDESLMSEEVLCVSPYIEDIQRHLRESEMKLRPRPGYLEKHPEITSGMRVILVDWLVEVVQEYKLRSETLHLAVNYLDRFLSSTAYVKRGKLQLVGTAALMIAAKYEEIFPPELTEFVYITDSTYTKRQLVCMEHVFLKVLAFKMAAPTTNQFLHLYMSVHSVGAITEYLAKYIAELSLVEIDPFLPYTPSIVAAGAYCLATFTVKNHLWPDSLHAFTGYTMADIEPCLTGLHKLYSRAESHPQQTIREKYKSSKMAEPAELLLIKDQYEQAFHCLSRGLAAEEAGEIAEALECHRKGQQHLTQGVEVPTVGERQHGAVWDTARQLQERMRDTLRTVNAHLTDLETSQLTTEHQRSRLLRDLPPNLYPDLAPNSQPPQSSLHHLYPSIPATAENKTPTPKTPPVRPPSPAALHTRTLPAAAMANSGDQPPAYTLQPTDGHRSLGYGLAGLGLGSGKLAGEAEARGDGNELLFIPSGVQMFFVAQNGQVSSLSSPGYLRIVTFDSQPKDSTAGTSSAFLHVCDWLYPLTTDTPVLLANSGIFMFPDSLAEMSGCFVGIVLSAGLPASDRETFQDLLAQLTELRIQDPEAAGSEVINLSEKIPHGPQKEQTGLTVTGEKEKLPLPGWSEKISQGILSGATKLSVEFVKGAEATGRAIHRGAAKIRDHITPEETPSEVSPRVTKSLQAAKQATGGAVRVSQFLVNGVSTVAGHVAEKVAPHVKKHGAKLVPESLRKSKDGRASNLEGAKFVAASSVQGFSTIWSSLETGAKLIGKSVTAETVTTVTYKFKGLGNLFNMSSNI